MNKIRVIKKSESAAINRRNEPKSVIGKAGTRDSFEIVGGWVAEWKIRTEIETRRALADCTRLRAGSPLEM